ncbi:MAG: hypothetical protein ACXWB5_05435 [Kaistella sp.]
MQNLQDIQEKIFFESKTILETLSRINSKEELLAKQDLFAEVTDRIAFLRILDKNREHFIVEEQTDKFETDDQRNFSGNEIISPDSESFDESPLEDDLIEEEVMFTNELNEIENEEPLAETPPILETPVEFETEMVEEEMLAEIENEQNYEERVAQKEKEFRELEERRRMIVDFKKEDVIHPPKDEVFHETKSDHHHIEKKFKLAHIKGLKVVQNLFDDDPLEKIEEEEKAEIHERIGDSGSILKTNIPTDFMEAQKKKTEFRLDLNDKVAFTKLLFKGNDEELKYTVDKLNSFDNLEDAQQYLSEVYYQKDWGKADEYAQRLWNLVENKFL